MSDQWSTGNGTGTQTNEHTLTVQEMPAHTHNVGKQDYRNVCH